MLGQIIIFFILAIEGGISITSNVYYSTCSYSFIASNKQMFANMYVNVLQQIAHMRKHRLNSNIGTFQERQNKFSIYIIVTYTFNVVCPPWWPFLRV